MGRVESRVATELGFRMEGHVISAFVELKGLEEDDGTQAIRELIEMMLPHLRLWDDRVESRRRAIAEAATQPPYESQQEFMRERRIASMIPGIDRAGSY